MAAPTKRFENVLATLDRLSQREKYMVGGVAVGFVAFVGILVWLWISSSLSGLERRIANKTGRLMTIVELRQQYFSAPYPADTVVQVQALALPELLVEIEAIATLRK